VKSRNWEARKASRWFIKREGNLQFIKRERRGRIAKIKKGGPGPSSLKEEKIEMGNVNGKKDLLSEKRGKKTKKKKYAA